MYVAWHGMRGAGRRGSYSVQEFRARRTRSGLTKTIRWSIQIRLYDRVEYGRRQFIRYLSRIGGFFYTAVVCYWIYVLVHDRAVQLYLCDCVQNTLQTVRIYKQSLYKQPG